ncbi:MAG: ABC transporter substrate-binding protein [Turicibacter sp.]|nr:ABC transporter substrate-binding protein [Turicibacter sp.]
MKKMFLLATLLVFVACGNAGGGVGGASATEGEMTLTMALMTSLDALPIFMAQERGYFEDFGLTVNMYTFSAARDRDIAFQANDNIDGLVFDFVALSIYNEAGIEMVAAASSLGLASLIGADGVETFDDLPGATILISRSTAMEYIMDRSLQAANLSHDEVNIEEVPSLPTRLEMLLNGQAQAATLPEPFATIARESGLNTIATTRTLDINPFIYAFRREVVEEKNAELQAFFNGVNAAVDFMNNSPREDFIDALIDIVGFPEESRDTLILPEFVHMRVPDARHAADVLDFARSIGLLTIDLTAEDVIVDVFGQ